MEHTGAIALYLFPLLLALLGAVACWGAYGHRRFVSRNESEHANLQNQTQEQNQRLTRVETKVEYVENELKYFRK